MQPPLADAALLLALYTTSCIGLCLWLEHGDRPIPGWLRSALTLYTLPFIAIAAALLTIVARARGE